VALPVVPVATSPNAADALVAIRTEIGDCTRCKLHTLGRTQIVFGVGNPNARLMFVGEAPGSGRIALGSKGGVFRRDGAEHLWRYEPSTRAITRRAVKLPAGVWEYAPMRWARDAASGLLYVADAEGALFSFDEERGFSAPLARVPLAPVGPMAVTHDGRVFGFCGAEIGKLFIVHPSRREVATLGVAVSVIERRRYGYVFGDAVTGRDGQIFFGEDDNLGHLWIYFPKIERPQV